MLEHLAKYISVYFLSMIKFVGGPLSGIAFGLNVLETVLFSVLGMMTSVTLFSFVGEWFKTYILPRIRTQKSIFTSKNRKIVTIWKKYGIEGVAFLTPVIFSPIIGTMVAVSFRASKKKIFLYMFLSAIFWGVTLSLILHKVGQLHTTGLGGAH